MLRPVNYFVEDLGPDIRQILAVGNPVLFWGTIWTIPYCAWAWWRKRDWTPGFMVVAFAGLYLPWFLVARPQFFFYALPFTPFMALAAVYTLRDLAAAHLVIRERGTGEVALDPDTGEPAISRRRPTCRSSGATWRRRSGSSCGCGRSSPRAASPTRCGRRASGSGVDLARRT